MFELATFIRREDADRFIEEVRGDDPEFAGYLPIEERGLEAGGRREEGWFEDQPSCASLTSRSSWCRSSIEESTDPACSPIQSPSRREASRR